MFPCTPLWLQQLTATVVGAPLQTFGHWCVPELEHRQPGRFIVYVVFNDPDGTVFHFPDPAKMPDTSCHMPEGRDHSFPDILCTCFTQVGAFALRPVIPDKAGAFFHLVISSQHDGIMGGCAHAILPRCF